MCEAGRVELGEASLFGIKIITLAEESDRRIVRSINIAKTSYVSKSKVSLYVCDKDLFSVRYLGYDYHLA